MRPMPRMPTLRPEALRAKGSLTPRPQSPLRAFWIAISKSRACAIHMATARSATSSLRTSGVLVTRMPRAVAAATSMAS